MAHYLLGDAEAGTTKGRKAIIMSAYPTSDEIEDANQMALCRWYRYLHSPDTDERIGLLNRIIDRWREGGGFTPEISKAIG